MASLGLASITAEQAVMRRSWFEPSRQSRLLSSALIPVAETVKIKLAVNSEARRIFSSRSFFDALSIKSEWCKNVATLASHTATLANYERAPTARAACIQTNTSLAVAYASRMTADRTG